MKPAVCIILALLTLAGGTFRSWASEAGVELRQVLAAAGVQNPLHEDLQRAVDGRLTKMESKGIDGCGLFKGEIHQVHNDRELRSLSNKLKPGDQLVLAGSDWNDAKITFAGAGTAEAPILIRPEKPGSVVFSGDAQIIFYGSHLIITGLEFKEVNVTKNGAVIFRLGNGKEKPADHCIVNRIRMENCGSPSPADWPRFKAWLMTVIGPDNTVANSTFTGFKHIGQMIGAGDLPPKELQRLHVLNNHFGERPKIDDQNGYEIIQIGWSGEHARPAGSLIQGNTFEHCDGENEVITVKASDVVVRGNHFNGCQGVLSLREGNRVLVQGNVFDGQGRKNTGGITLEGADHVIVGNTFRDLKAPRNYYFWTIAMMSGSGETPADDVAGYGRAKNILIVHNRFEHCDARIAVGVYPRKEYPLLPKNIQVRENVFIGSQATTPFDYIAPDPSGEMAKEIHEAKNQFQP